jgi:hypothetical protein
MTPPPKCIQPRQFHGTKAVSKDGTALARPRDRAFWELVTFIELGQVGNLAMTFLNESQLA